MAKSDEIIKEPNGLAVTKKMAKKLTSGLLKQCLNKKNTMIRKND